MIDVACVCIGDKYDPWVYVQYLYRSVSRHLGVPHRFNVITDNPDHELYKQIDVNVIKAPDWDNLASPDTAWWYKMYLFSEEACFTGKVLYFDLDVLILKNIDKFATYKDSPENFMICQDFNRQFVPTYKISNSSVMRWTASTKHWMYHEFRENMDQIVKRHRGDQDLITALFVDRKEKLWWPREWAMSYKWEILHGGLTKPNTSDYNSPDEPYIIPADTSVVVYHGKPDPWETKLGQDTIDPDLLGRI